MPRRLVPYTAPCGANGAVTTADQLATQAGMALLTSGGNAVDAALAANAVLAVTGPHLCGLGGDLFAIVHTTDGEMVGLNASGRAGSGSDSSALRDEGLTEMPMRHDIRSVTVPGCVDGWAALHDRFGSRPLTDIVAPAVRLAARGFPASPLLIRALAGLDESGTYELSELAEQATRPGAIVRRPGVALELQSIASGGRRAFYEGLFGEGLLSLGGGLFTGDDLRTVQAEWVDPLHAEVFGADVATIGPNSQGYLTLATAALAERAGLPADPDDAAWAHLLIEAATAAAHDRSTRLYDGADGPELLRDLATRIDMVDSDRASPRRPPTTAGDTTYLATADRSGLAVSLIQSNASGFGSWMVEPTTGINLHNRGLGFSLLAGHPAELAPGRRPPHTLSPAMVRRDGHLLAVLGTMGGDAQPQIVAQLLARILHGGEDVASAVAAPRWTLRGSGTGFDTWTSDHLTVGVEDGAADAWRAGLETRGWNVVVDPAYDSAFGHAHAITVDADGRFHAAADPRAVIGTAAAH